MPMYKHTTKEDGTMRTSNRMLRKLVALPVVAAMAFALGACGGGGGGTTGSASPGTAGPATVDISIAAAEATGSAAPAVAVSGPDTVPSTDPDYLWPEQVTQPDPRITHVYMDVVKISLLPAAETFEGGDMDGEMQTGNSPYPPCPPDKPHFITIVPEDPIRIDLLNLGSKKKFARFLNKFDRIPAGTFDKIRVYYDNVTVLVDGRPDPVRFHPTAHSKFDIHFRQGRELVVPAASDGTQQDGWVKFLSVKLDVVGLKLRIVNAKKDWDKAKVILRPQIFAEFVPPILYSVAGNAGNVVKAADPPNSGTFDVSFDTGMGYPRTIPVSFRDGTKWAYSDDVLHHSCWIVEFLDTTPLAAFRARAKVMAIGLFDTSLVPPVLQARDIVYSFPAVAEGRADNVWLPPDNTAFIVRSLTNTDNVTVYPQPDRFNAYYDNWTSSPHGPLDYTDLDNNLLVRARGYFEDPGDLGNLRLWAYWISIGETITVGP